MSSIKYIGETVSNELFELSKRKKYSSFTDLLLDIDQETSTNSRQLDILIKIDSFETSGNQRKLFGICNICELFKGGEAKQIKKERIDGTEFDEIVKRHATGKTKSGKESKSYTLLDTVAIIREREEKLRPLHLEGLGTLLKARNSNDYGLCRGCVRQRIRAQQTSTSRMSTQ